jgi:hypothetical protein
MRSFTRTERVAAAVAVSMFLTPGESVPDRSPPERPPEVTFRTLTSRPDRIEISVQLPAPRLHPAQRTLMPQSVEIAGTITDNGLIIGSLTGLREGDFSLVAGRAGADAVGRVRVYTRREADR